MDSNRITIILRSQGKHRAYALHAHNWQKHQDEIVDMASDQNFIIGRVIGVVGMWKISPVI